MRRSSLPVQVQLVPSIELDVAKRTVPFPAFGFLFFLVFLLLLETLGVLPSVSCSGFMSSFE